MRWLLAILFFLPFSGRSQGSSQALLWRITSPDSSRTGHLLGTVHSRDARAYGQMPQALPIIADCDGVYGELDLDVAKADKAKLMKAMMLPPGKSLRDLYSARKYKRVEAALKKHLGPLALMMKNLKPIYLSAMLAEGQERKDSAEVLDEYVLHHAQALGKTIGGLETVEEQMATMDRMTLPEQADLLYEALRSKAGEKDLEKLLTAYAAQDLTAIHALMQKGVGTATFDRALIQDRNHTMAHRMDSLMTQRRCFFAIGAAHLPGEEGVLTLLRQLGYRVEAVLPKQER
jgi:uncharacterized protein